MIGTAYWYLATALSYPDDQWWRDIPLMDTAADSLSGAPQAAMRRYLGAMAGPGHGAAQRAYVDTFDLRRRCCLYLTYYSCGDTRKRGMAMLQFTAAYRVAGFELIAGELPDHLAVLCEFTAAAPDGAAPCSGGTALAWNCCARHWTRRSHPGCMSSTPSVPSCPVPRHGTCSVRWS